MKLNEAIQYLIDGLRQEHDERTGHDALAYDHDTMKPESTGCAICTNIRLAHCELNKENENDKLST